MKTIIKELTIYDYEDLKKGENYVKKNTWR